MKICISGSMIFYDQFCELKNKLEEAGHSVFIPSLESEEKGTMLSSHLKEIDNSDCLLVVNYRKNDIENYVGNSTFLEMGYAYGTKKPIYLLNSTPLESLFKEEIVAMRPIMLNGNLSKIN